jgi:hypothetical protein
MTDYNPATLLAAENAFAPQSSCDPTAFYALQKCREQIPTPRDPWHQCALWVIAPVLAGFALWLAEQTRHYSNPIILGVMREGRLLTPHISSTPQEIALNRRLTMLAAFGAGDDEALLNWLVRTRLQPISRSAAITELTGITTNHDSTPLTLQDAQDLLHNWHEQGTLPAIRARADQLGDRLMNHWHQHIPAAATNPVLLIDFATVGNIQRSLHTLLQKRNLPSNVIGLNFVTTAGTKWAREQGCTLHGYLANNGTPEWMAAAYARTPELIEIFTAAPLGALEDFTTDGTPHYQKTFLNPAQQTLLQETQDTILKAASFYQQQMSPHLTTELGRCLWGRLLLAPHPAEANAIGNWPLDAGLDGSAQRCLAPIMTTPEPWHKMQTAWPAASRLLSPSRLLSQGQS